MFHRMMRISMNKRLLN